jgi:hypothetical protein
LNAAIVDAGEYVGEPSLRIDVVELGGLDQRVHHGGALAAAVGAGEQPRLAAKRDAAQGPAVGEKPDEAVPTLEHVVHRLGDLQAGIPMTNAGSWDEV